MKRVLLLTLIIMLVMLPLASCGQNGSGQEGAAESGPEAGPALDPSEIKTMGDVFACTDGETYSEGFTENYYACVIDVGGVYYRAVAKMPEDVSKELWALDYDDEDRDQKQRDLISPLEPEKFENLTEMMPSQEELDEKYVGKTGQDLFDEGWTYNFYNLEDMEAGFDGDLFSYTVRFEYDGPQMENTDDFDFEKEFSGLKIASVTCDGVGQGATTVE